jgi:HK97 family phage major capsid protein
VSADDKGQAKAATPAEQPTLTHSQCINRLQEIRDAMGQIAELANPSSEDDRYFAELRDEFDRTDGWRKHLERQAELERIQSTANGLSVARGLKTVPGAFGGVGAGSGSSDAYDSDAILEPDSVQAKRFRNPWDLTEMRTWGRSREEVNSEYRARAISAIEHMPSSNDRIRSVSIDIIERFDDKDATLARLALVSSSPQYLRAFSKAATNRLHTLTGDEQRALEETRALSLTDSAGGYLVPFQLDPTVIITANGSRNDIRRIARQVVATGDVWNGVTAGAVSWSWDAEASQVSDDSPTFAQPSIPVYKAAGFVPVSIEALQDMANGAQEIARLLAFGREELEAAAFAIGTGSGQPTGVVTGLVGSGAVTPSATTDTLAVGDLYNIQGSLPARYRAGASWLATNLFYNRARQFDTAGGSSLWATLGDDRPSLLLGRPAYEAEAMDGVITGAAENYMAIFGDFENFVIADRIGMTVEFIPHLFRQTTAGAGFGQPTGQRGWYAYYRTGSAVVNTAAFKLLNVT